MYNINLNNITFKYFNKDIYKYCFKLLKHSSIYTLAFYCLANAERRTRTHTHTYRQELPPHQNNSMSSACGRMQDYLQRTHAFTGRTYKLSTEGVELSII